MTTPTTLRAGDTYRQLLQPGDYSAADGWVMKQRFTPRAAGTAIELTATAEDAAHLFAVAPGGGSGTATWAAGEYTAVRWVEQGADVFTLAQWQLTITPNLLGYYAAQAKPFNVLFTSNGIASHNEPWGQWWVDDFDDLMTRATVGTLNSSGLNGATGKLCVLKGDTHSLHAVSYRSNGAAGGLGGASYSDHELWEICPGTLNGSGTAATSFQYKLFGQRVHLKRDATGPRGRDYHAFLHVTVHASETPQRMVVRMVETTSGQAEVIWQGQWRADVAGNGFARVNEAQNIG